MNRRKIFIGETALEDAARRFVEVWNAVERSEGVERRDNISFVSRDQGASVLHITNDAEHAEAMAEIDRLWDIVSDTQGGVNLPEGRRFNALIDAVIEYEKRRWVIDLDD